MSDLVWVALISAGSALIGSAITAILSFKITKNQVKARFIELEKQFNHEKNEAKIERIIATRKDCLLPLRNKLSQWINENSVWFVKLNIYIKEKDPSLRAKYYSEFSNLSDVTQSLFNDIKSLSTQISDPQLFDMVNTIIDLANASSEKTTPLFIKITDSQKYSPAQLKKFISEIHDINIDLRRQVIPLNQQIEKLLAGD